MKIVLTPFRDERELSFKAEGNVLTIYLDGQEDVFDFSEMPDGEVEEIESELPICPIQWAEKKNGEVRVKVLNFYGPTPSPEDLEDREVEL